MVWVDTGPLRGKGTQIHSVMCRDSDLSSSTGTVNTFEFV